MNVITRFAPSPTGYLHLGNVRTALFNALYACCHKGKFLLRIEDTDLARSSLAFVEAIQNDLRWLGLSQIDKEAELVWQSKRYALYQRYMDTLKNNGNIYPCFCTEERLMQLKETQRLSRQPIGYDGHCRYLSTDILKAYQIKKTAYHLRFHIPDAQLITFNDLVKGTQQFKSKSLHDFVIQRSDGHPTFLYCNALDDALMGITHVLRGEDHLSNTAKQLLIMKALDLKPPIYCHMPLISSQSDTQPLSKREGSFSLRSLRKKGYLSLAIINYLARLGYTIASDKLMSLTELAALFFPEKVHKGTARFDHDQLDYWQKKAISQQAESEFWDALQKSSKQNIPLEKRSTFIKLIQPMVMLSSEADSWANIFFTDLGSYDLKSEKAICAVNSLFWDGLLQLLQKRSCITAPALLNALKVYIKTQDKGKEDQKLCWKAVRVALTHCFKGPDIASVISLLGVEETIKRFKAAALLFEKSGI